MLHLGAGEAEYAALWEGHRGWVVVWSAEADLDSPLLHRPDVPAILEDARARRLEGIEVLRWTLREMDYQLRQHYSPSDARGRWRAGAAYVDQRDIELILCGAWAGVGTAVDLQLLRPTIGTESAKFLGGRPLDHGPVEVRPLPMRHLAAGEVFMIGAGAPPPDANRVRSALSTGNAESAARTLSDLARIQETRELSIVVLDTRPQAEAAMPDPDSEVDIAEMLAGLGDLVDSWKSDNVLPEPDDAYGTDADTARTAPFAPVRSHHPDEDSDFDVPATAAGPTLAPMDNATPQPQRRGDGPTLAPAATGVQEIPAVVAAPDTPPGAPAGSLAPTRRDTTQTGPTPKTHTTRPTVETNPTEPRAGLPIAVLGIGGLLLVMAIGLALALVL